MLITFKKRCKTVKIWVRLFSLFEKWRWSLFICRVNVGQRNNLAIRALYTHYQSQNTCGGAFWGTRKRLLQFLVTSCWTISLWMIFCWLFFAYHVYFFEFHYLIDSFDRFTSFFQLYKHFINLGKSWLE